MEVRELRVGNYYIWKSEGKDYLYQVEKRDFGSDNYKNFYSVSLTEEWLLDFGFKNIDKYTFKKGNWFIYKRKRGFVTGSKQRELKLEYVHLVQNWWFGNNQSELELKSN